MSRYLMTVVLCTAGLFTNSLLAQSDKLYRVRGEVTGGPRDQSGISVELIDASRHQPVERVPLSQNGAFEFSHVATGTYQVRVLNQEGTVLRQDYYVVNQMGGDLTIALPEESADKPTGDSVSVARLKHQIPSKARKAFAAAQKRFEAHDPNGSAEKLREAVALDPEYLEAHNNLGCRLLSMGRTKDAIQSFQRAIELDPLAPFAHGNLAVALLHEQRPEEAEAAARVAIKTDGGISKMKYVLGMALFNQRKFTPEAAQALRQSEDDFPNARLAAAAVFERLGEVKEAKAELNTYLGTAGAIRQTEVKAWLSRLQ
ncbi:MAG: tetratricopeptide repeat protein [Bryobacteraceae bacterium]